ncbi:hypothetical protein [Lactobacillus acetotolerans]|uniref:Replication associated protein n=1 Tax=Lactobacillus acetotolerans TaxID=1600 RepID=A0A5P5ZG72_9LACO|nr:hypothetical protein [Lactobacillus acetotolerans]KRN41476.1 hypothetical protein FC77_GL000285 [Lactobacillus acetotolerans DSM 20749 = JCM 3825]QFG50685.1 replication associated protein [Lactobacillus acetotolerans]GGV12519.1 hypothetical protein GCM10011628_07480 [Lactobacillus acetotolerans DSM 20749 = JCM 3825]
MKTKNIFFINKFKKQYRKVKKNFDWNSIFTGTVPFDNKKRSPWDYIIYCLFNSIKIPNYFYPHHLTLTNKFLKQLQKRFGPNTKFQIIELHFDGHSGDHLLIYAENDENIFLIAIGSHSDLF